MNKKNSIIGIIYITITIFIWGITFVNTKSLLNDFSPLEILILRFFIAYISLWIIRPKVLKLNNKKEEIYFLIAGLLGITIYQFTENIAINFTTASNVSIIVSICPIFTAIIAQIFLKEKHFTKNFAIGFILAFIGIILVSFNGRINLKLNPLGDFLALFAGISWGFYSLFLTKINNWGYDNILSTRRMFFWALVFMIPIGLFGKNFACTKICFDKDINILRFKNFYNYFNLIFLGLGASALCFVIWNKTCKLIGTVKTNIGIYMIPVVTIIFAHFALNEKITLLGMIGTFLTIAGLVVSEKK